MCFVRVTAAIIKTKSGSRGWKLGRCGDKRESGRNKIADLPKLPGRMSKNANSERKGKDCI